MEQPAGLPMREPPAAHDCTRRKTVLPTRIGTMNLSQRSLLTSQESARANGARPEPEPSLDTRLTEGEWQRDSQPTTYPGFRHVDIQTLLAPPAVSPSADPAVPDAGSSPPPRLAGRKHIRLRVAEDRDSHPGLRLSFPREPKRWPRQHTHAPAESAPTAQ